MRLLRLENDGKFSLVEYINSIPQYAILSHTWGPAHEEVTFEDLREGKGKNKAGYRKLAFCRKQAAKDGLQFFWVDTCCIDKSSSTELSEAINSMFRWYYNAAKCYVYLSDVSGGVSTRSGLSSQRTRELALQHSKWFTRGWTLQELLAPRCVEFFSAEGDRLGSRISLLQELHNITGICLQALQGSPLSQFSVEERLSWAKDRQTTRDEDTAYSLLGIFQVSLPPLYGEGRSRAFVRLQKEIKESLKDHFPSDAASAEELAKEKERCLVSLSFDTINARQQDIASAHRDTCNWIFETTQFRRWHYQIDLQSHNRVLWIKGKPGAGKSTLMKYTLRHCSKFFKDYVTVAYFFNARGDSLEKTPLGMLRSLTYQLLEHHYLYERFLPLFRDKERSHAKWGWKEVELMEFLLSAVKIRHLKPLLFLIDALDECRDSDVREVVEFLEELSVNAVAADANVHICLSSRHYPTISMKKNLELVVERQKEHDDDITRYVHDKLKAQDQEIEEEILRKADGVFMWVVLVVAMLNRAYDEGKLEAMHQKLNELPRDLEQLFETLLGKDNPDRHEMMFLLQAVLFARRALKPEELYFAMMATTDAKNLGAWDQLKINDDVVQRRITSSSRGLIEIRKGVDRTVQFIHETVNDFLLRNGRLQTLDPNLKLSPIGTSHDCLKTCCMSYITMKGLQISKEGSTARDLASSYPFLQYASTYVFDHAEEAQRGGVTQKEFLHSLQHEHEKFARLRHFHNAFEDIPGLGCGKGVTLLYTLSFHGCHRLVSIVTFEEQININAHGGPYGNALQAAVLQGQNDIVRRLLERGADMNRNSGLYSSALQAALATGNEEIVRVLIEKGADVNQKGGLYGSTLQAASATKNKEIVRVLLKQGADVNVQGGVYGNALQAASTTGNKDIVDMLLKNGADINAQGGVYGLALQAASYQGHNEIVQTLLEKGADVNTDGGLHGSALQAASATGNEDIVMVLLREGANVNAQGGAYGNALQAAPNGGNTEIMELLLKTGAEVNDHGGIYGHALSVASFSEKIVLPKGALGIPGTSGTPDPSGNHALQDYQMQLMLLEQQNKKRLIKARNQEEMCRILNKKGADVIAQGGVFSNTLQAAAYQGQNKTVRALLEVHEIDVNAIGGLFGSALQAASATGNNEIVEVLLEKGADVNAQGGVYGNALSATLVGVDMETIKLEKGAAGTKGKEDILEFLLRKGIDVNAQGGVFGNALQVASYEGQKDAVQTLLKKGADVNATGGVFGNALQAASAAGNWEVVVMLLDEEADVNARGGVFGNALQAACATRNWKIMGMLLERGADLNGQCGVYCNSLQSNGWKNGIVDRLSDTCHRTGNSVVVITALVVVFILFRIWA